VVNSQDYIPQCGDAVWITLNPQAGHEQAGRRPAVVISPQDYNGKVGLAIFCPITNQIKGYPFEVRIPTRLCELPTDTISQVLQKLIKLLNPEI
jgi:mRNA interferase MazF